MFPISKEIFVSLNLFQLVFLALLILPEDTIKDREKIEVNNITQNINCPTEKSSIHSRLTPL